MFGVKPPGGKSPVLMVVIVLVLVLAVSIIPLVILLGSPQPDSSTQQEGSGFVQAPQGLNTDQGIIVSADKTTLYVPEDAIDSNLTGNFVILPGQPDSYSFASESGWSRPIVVNIEYRNEEGVHYPGITFSKPVHICFTLTAEQWNDFLQRPDDFQVQYFDNAKSPFRWISVPMTTDPERFELCSQTDHLSIYALAIKTVAQIPITGVTPIPTAGPSPIPVPIFTSQGNRRDPDPDVVTPVPPQPTEPPPTEPLPTEPPPTEPPPTEPPTEPPPTEPPVEPPPTEPPPV